MSGGIPRGRFNRLDMKLDLAANFLTSLWVGVLTLIFTPVYVHYLGVEAYGLIGLLAALQNSLGLLDLSLGQMLSRELARFTGGGISAASTRNLVRSIEVIALGLAVLVVVALTTLNTVIASAWLRPERLAASDLSAVLPVIGVIVALRVLEGLYRGAVVGIGQQIWLNAITAACATLKAAGALVLFWTVSRGISVFFTWQALVSALNVGLLVALLYASLPAGGLRGSFSQAELSRVWSFGAGLLLLSLLAMVLSQADKLMLSKLLPLSAYGAYTLAATLAAAPHLLAAPVLQASQPRFARALAQSDFVGVSALFHASSQLMTVLLGSAVAVLAFFARDVLELWLGNRELARQVEPVVRLLTLGNLFYALVWLPNALQLAHGSTGLIVRTSAAVVAVLVPGLLIVAPVYQGQGAAWLWLALNFGYFVAIAVFLFETHLPGERLRWLVQDIGWPLASAFAVAGLASVAVPLGGGVAQRLTGLGVAAGLTLAAAAGGAPLIRGRCADLLVRAQRYRGRGGEV